MVNCYEVCDLPPGVFTRRLFYLANFDINESPVLFYFCTLIHSNLQSFEAEAMAIDVSPLDLQ